MDDTALLEVFVGLPYCQEEHAHACRRSEGCPEILVRGYHLVQDHVEQSIQVAIRTYWLACHLIPVFPVGVLDCLSERLVFVENPDQPRNHIFGDGIFLLVVLPTIALRLPNHMLAKSHGPGLDHLAQTCSVKTWNGVNNPLIEQVRLNPDEGKDICHHRASQRILKVQNPCEVRHEILSGHHSRHTNAPPHELGLARTEARKKGDDALKVGRCSDPVHVETCVRSSLKKRSHDGTAQLFLWKNALQAVQLEIQQAVLIGQLVPKLAGLSPWILVEASAADGYAEGRGCQVCVGP
mmetsp:Transcript_31430/g.56377  ORF Transcript_31430/g.56377 Transcript_31430/m.56377 type:complete len:295 (+) Transcript_31430:426-1310(+)